MSQILNYVNTIYSFRAKLSLISTFTLNCRLCNKPMCYAGVFHLGLFLIETNVYYFDEKVIVEPHKQHLRSFSFAEQQCFYLHGKECEYVSCDSTKEVPLTFQPSLRTAYLIIQKCFIIF